jgi:pimeloyl-ACP methyl ester carboxylesterase
MTTLVLLPGMDGTGELFAPLLTVLDSRLETVVIQYPRSFHLEYKDLVTFVRDELPTNDEFIILGESFSGPIAVSLAAQAPLNLRGLILCASFVRCPVPWSALLRPLTRLIPFGAIPTSVLSVPLLGPFGNSGIRRLLANTLSTVSASVLRDRIRSVLTVDVREEAAAVEVPFLLLQASADWLVPRSASMVMRELVPALQVTKLLGPHMLLQISPRECAHAIEAFVDETILKVPPA